MKLFLLALVFCVQSFGWQAYFEIDASVTNVPAAFSTAAGSKVFGSTLLVGPRVLTIYNGTASRICINNQTYDGSTPSTKTHSIPAGQTIGIGARYAPVVFINGCGSAILAGVVQGWSD